MSRKKVVVYCQPDCPPCYTVKEFLVARGVEFEEKDVTADSQAVRELTDQYKSRSTPTIVVGDEVMIGFDPARLERMLAD
ncbi:MAG TPA: glutaredoxin domain-containing protein [Candidatus Angelobacter sp.]|nr:glutaredoxin domain-containing protein [Candidatus Angelobacter sp.]